MEELKIGVKHDSNKPRFSLLPLKELWQVVEVLEFGAKKYAIDNWKYVKDSKDRYYDAAMRHITARQDGERLDQESKMPHLAHAICCLFFYLWHDNNGTNDKKEAAITKAKEMVFGPSTIPWPSHGVVSTNLDPKTPDIDMVA